MKQQLKIAIWFTLVTTVLCGIAYPLIVTGLAQLLFPAQANGTRVEKDGAVLGSRLIGQPFSSAWYFHPRPSAAGNGYDPLASGGSNLAATNRQLLERVRGDVQKIVAENPGVPVPVDLVTTSASGLDPDISPAAAEFQVSRVARARHMTETELRTIVAQSARPRQFGVLGEPRVNVLELNLALDATHPMR
jgi:K+-transporting ATPase ATPase C chain